MRLLLRVLIACSILFGTSPASATHNEAGEILVCHVGGLQYEVTIITHTNPNSLADRPDFILNWGDNFIDTIPRLSQTRITVGTEQVY